MTNRLEVTHSEIQAFLGCRKKWLHSYVDLLTTNGESQALRIDNFVHEYTESLLRNELPESADDLERKTALYMTRAAYNKLELEMQKFLDAEVVFEKRIPGTHTILKGKYDAAIQGVDGNPAIVEFKSTGLELNQAAQMYECSWQHRLYAYAWWLQTGNFPNVIYVIIERPTPILTHQYKKPISDDERLQKIQQWFADKERVVLVHHQFMEMEVREVQEQLPAILQEMRRVKNNPKLAVCNRNNCFSFNNKCKFFDLCNGLVDKDHFDVKPVKHSELTEDE